MDAPLALPHPGGSVAMQRDTDGMMKAIMTYRRQAPLFLAVLTSVVLLALAFSLLQTPRYTATASVMIAPRKVEVGPESATPADPLTDANVDSQVEVLKSGLLAGAVVDALQLTNDRAFLASLDPPGRLSFLHRGGTAAPGSISRPAAIQKLEKGLAIRRVAQTLVLEIAFSSPDAALAARIANGYANAFVAQSVDLKLQDSRSSNALLGSQLDKLRRQVEAAETAVSQYKIQNNLLSVAGSTMAEQEIVSLDQEVAANRAAAAEASARLDTARQQLARGSHGDDLGESLNSPVIQELRKERSEVSGKLADLQVGFGPRYPEVVSAKQQIADIDRQIDAEIKRLISNLDAQNQVAQRRLDSMQGSVGAARGQLTTANTASVRLDELQRTADSVRTLYEGVLNRMKETQTQEATAEPDARVSNYAVAPPAPSSPKLAINLLIGVLLGTGAGIALVFLREETDTGLRTLEDVEQRLGVPYFGALPTLKSSVRKPLSPQRHGLAFPARIVGVRRSLPRAGGGAGDLHRAGGTEDRGLHLGSAARRQDHRCGLSVEDHGHGRAEGGARRLRPASPGRRPDLPDHAPGRTDRGAEGRCPAGRGADHRREDQPSHPSADGGGDLGPLAGHIAGNGQAVGRAEVALRPRAAGHLARPPGHREPALEPEGRRRGHDGALAQDAAKSGEHGHPPAARAQRRHRRRGVDPRRSQGAGALRLRRSHLLLPPLQGFLRVVAVAADPNRQAFAFRRGMQGDHRGVGLGSKASSPHQTYAAQARATRATRTGRPSRAYAWARPRRSCSCRTRARTR